VILINFFSIPRLTAPRELLPGCLRALTATLTLGLAVVTPVFADITVPTGGTMALNGATVDLGCSDVTVAGSLSLGGGTLANVRNLAILSGGALSTGAGQITLSGNWTNAGSFSADTGQVNFVDVPACAASSTLAGSTSFFDLSMISTVGKLYLFEVGSTQRVARSLTMTGTLANPTRINSTVPGQLAFINLQGGQNLSGLAVRDMGATGVWLAAHQSNLDANAVVSRWFGAGEVIPTLGHAGLLALILLVLGFATCAIRSQSLNPLNRKDARHEA
jgi:hypothetical protein